jgi:hypothetical protein
MYQGWGEQLAGQIVFNKVDTQVHGRSLALDGALLFPIKISRKLCSLQELLIGPDHAF